MRRTDQAALLCPEEATVRFSLHPHWLRLSVAPAAVLVAFGVRLLLLPLTGHEGPFLLFFGAVMFSAWVGGRSAGILATALITPLAVTFFLLPDTNLIGLSILAGLFVLDGMLVSMITGQLQTTANRAARHEAELSSLIDGVQDYAIFLLDPAGRVVSWNNGAVRIKGYAAAEIIGQPFTRFYTPEDSASGMPQAALQAAAAGRYAGEGWRVRKDGTRFWASIVITPLHDSTGHLTGFAKVTRDVTEPQRQAEALRASEARFSGMIDAALDAIIGVDAQERVRVFNPAAERLFGYPASEALGADLERFIPPALRARHHSHMAAFGQSGRTNRTMGGPGISGLRADGSLVPLEVSVARLSVDGQPFYTAILRDISARLASEQALHAAHDELEAHVVERTAALANANATLAQQAQDLLTNADSLRASLQEKEVLLREIHHRVKNNLQVVMSLLRLQSRQVSDTQALAALGDSRQRVEVMALVHELLYRTGDMAAIDADTYIRQLSNHLLRIYGISPAQVQVSLATEKIWLSLDHAVPCGLIINELFSNSLKYAFPDGQPGMIGIALHASPPGMLTLTVWDTGAGFAASAAVAQPPSLGMTLVHDLVRQIHGSAVITSGAGVTVTITFPLGATTAQDAAIR